MKKGKMTYEVALYLPASFVRQSDQEYYAEILPTLKQHKEHSFWDLTEDEARFICDHNKVYSVRVYWDNGHERPEEVHYIQGNEEWNEYERQFDQITPVWIRQIFNLY